MFPPNCTLVTCCFDLTYFNEKCRNLEDTINNMRSLLEIPCYLVIFTDNICIGKIKEIRKFELFTHYIEISFENLHNYKYLETIKKNRILYHPTKDERTCSESHLICCSKFQFVLQIIELNPFHTDKFGWIDSNVGINFKKICGSGYTKNLLPYILENTLSDKFHIQILNVCDKKYKNTENKREYYSQYRWVVCGSLFTCGKEIGEKILTRLNDIFIKTTLEGYGHGEEMFYLEIIDEFYNNIEKGYGDYNNILHNFIRPSQELYYITYIIQNYLKFGYYKECYDCCKKVLNEIETYQCDFNYSDYYIILFSLYISTFYYKNNDSLNIVNHITELINTNSFIKTEYEKKKEFYDIQFKFSQLA